MDENGRNGGNWHLAQQITYHVTLYIFQQFTHHVIALSHKYEFGGIFLILIKEIKIPPIHYHNNLQFVNK